MPTALLFALSLAGAEAPAPPLGFCTALDAIIAAADEPTPFRSLETPAGYGTGAWSTQVIPGYDHCWILILNEVRTVTCARTLAPRELTANNLALETGACLGEAPTPSVWDPTVGEMVFDLGRVRIVVEETCDDRCHVGRRVSYNIEARSRK